MDANITQDFDQTVSGASSYVIMKSSPDISEVWYDLPDGILLGTSISTNVVATVYNDGKLGIKEREVLKFLSEKEESLFKSALKRSIVILE